MHSVSAAAKLTYLEAYKRFSEFARGRRLRRPSPDEMVAVAESYLCVLFFGGAAPAAAHYAAWGAAFVTDRFVAAS
eukprot:11200700-Lingulodinium_polyedra.AAC.1